MDVTDGDISELMSIKSSNSRKFPGSPKQQKPIIPMFNNISVPLMTEFLTEFTAFQTRYFKSASGQKAAEFLYNRIRKIASNHRSNVMISVKKFKHPWAQFSIIARIESNYNNFSLVNQNQNEAEKEELPLVIISAHLDSINQDNPWIGRAPGADDDGSGTTTILEVFRLLVTSGFSPINPIEFHWYSAEEGGLLGSQKVVAAYVEAKIPILSMYQVDMTGYSPPDKNPVIGIATDNVSVSLGKVLQMLADEYCSIEWIDVQCGYACSDHFSWFSAGFDAIFTFESSFPDHSPYIHSKNDDVSNIDFEHVKEFNILVEHGLKRTFETLELCHHELHIGTLAISYSSIQAVDRKIYNNNGFPIFITTRALQFVKLYFPLEAQASQLYAHLQSLINITSMDQLYAFTYKPSTPYESNSGWSKYDPEREFQRMGVGITTNQWRFSKINDSFEFCPTYPRILVVPERISDNVLKHTGKFRSKARIPALSYLHKTNNITITRSSQPLAGINKNRSIQDEKLIEAIFNSGLIPPKKGYTHLIIDARPATNAMAQTAMGAGTESQDFYKGSKVVFLGIENIHVVRDSFNKLFDIISNSEVSSLSISSLDKSGWSRHIKSILDGALMIVHHVNNYNCHVLIHCSDGWDRTAQLSSLAQICLDPYFRTIHGLQILIEKEWCHFGHKFKDRCGHLSRDVADSSSLKSKFQSAGKNVTNSITSFLGKSNMFMQIQGGSSISYPSTLASSETSFVNNIAPKEVSPIFIQFIDSLAQIIRQYPNSFEYNGKLLEFLVNHIYSCQFGTFLFNNQKEKCEFSIRNTTGDQMKIEQCSFSIWDEIDSKISLFVNSRYENDHKSESSNILYPVSTDLQNWVAEMILDSPIIGKYKPYSSNLGEVSVLDLQSNMDITMEYVNDKLAKFKMSKKTVLITGANRGIGFEFVKQLSNTYNVIAVCRKSSKELDEILQSDNIIFLDLLSDDYSSILKSLTAHKVIDIVINNAGILSRTPSENVTSKEMHEAFHVNTIAPVMITQLLLPKLKLSPTPLVVNISSRVGSIDDNSSGGAIAYRASKAALNMVNKTFSIDIPDVVFLALHPGRVSTGMLDFKGDISPADSVSSMIKIIEQAVVDKSMTGKFYHKDGYILPW